MVTANKLIVAMAPYLQTVADKLVDVTQKGNGAWRGLSLMRLIGQ